jgi:hypothetical protein
MFYEDMIHEQENQTWFEVQDMLSGLPVRLRILSGDNPPYLQCEDHIEIQHSDDPPIVISPRGALQILSWLDFHRARLIENCRGEARDAVRQALEFSLVDTTFVDQLKKSSAWQNEEVVESVKAFARRWGVSEEVLDSLE